MVVQGTGTVGLAGWRVLFTHSSEGVLFCTEEGEITAANPAACAMLDMSADDDLRPRARRAGRPGGPALDYRRGRAGADRIGRRRGPPPAW